MHTVAPLLSLCALAALLATGSAIQCYVNKDWLWRARLHEPWDPFNVGKAELQQCSESSTHCVTENMTKPHFSDKFGQIHRDCASAGCVIGNACKMVKVMIRSVWYEWERCCCSTDGCNGDGHVPIPSKRKRCLTTADSDAEEICDDNVSYCRIVTVQNVTTSHPNASTEALRRRWLGKSQYGCDSDYHCVKYDVGDGRMKTVIEKDNYTTYEHVYYCCTPDLCNKAMPSTPVPGSATVTPTAKSTTSGGKAVALLSVLSLVVATFANVIMLAGN